jgi:hypothetical protein
MSLRSPSAAPQAVSVDVKVVIIMPTSATETTKIRRAIRVFLEPDVFIAASALIEQPLHVPPLGIRLPLDLVRYDGTASSPGEQP